MAYEIAQAFSGDLIAVRLVTCLLRISDNYDGRQTISADVARIGMNYTIKFCGYWSNS